MKILVSACLLGRNCKYNGGNNFDPKVAAFVEGKEVIEVCPEVLAGMGVPRVPMEIRDGYLVNREGENVDGPNRRAVEASWSSSGERRSPVPSSSPEAPPAASGRSTTAASPAGSSTAPGSSPGR